MRTRRLTILITFLILSLALTASAYSADADKQAKAVTTADPRLPTDELTLLLKPLTQSELLVEAEAWQAIVKDKAEEIAKAELAVRRQNKEVEKADEIRKQAEKTSEQLEAVSKESNEAKESGDKADVEEAQKHADEAKQTMEQVTEQVRDVVSDAQKTDALKQETGGATRQDLDTAVADAERANTAVGEVQDAVEQARDAAEGPATQNAAALAQQTAESAREVTESMQTRVDDSLSGAAADEDKAEALKAAAKAVANAKQIGETKKLSLLEQVNKLRGDRTLLLDNMRAVVKELEAKTPKGDSDTSAKIETYQVYLSRVSGIQVDVTDTTSAWVSVKGWLLSDEGGIRWLINVASFVGILVFAWFVARLLSSMMGKAVKRMRMPALLAEFLTNSVRWVVMIIGIIWALTALEISVAPLLAMVGAAGFIIAFAMQESLSNFASGLMILFFRPFDTGDIVDAGGVSGKVSSMNLVSTTIRTFDNKLMVVPNSKIWSDVITNATGVTERRVDMEFGIAYEADIDEAQSILEEIVRNHPKVLKTPAPTVKMHTLADSSVNFICRPWSTPGDYWDVYWDVTREVKKRFDAVGIGIPYPQRDIHLHIVDDDKQKLAAVTAPKPTADTPAKPDAAQHDDGGLDG